MNMSIIESLEKKGWQKATLPSRPLSYLILTYTLMQLQIVNFELQASLNLGKLKDLTSFIFIFHKMLHKLNYLRNTLSWSKERVMLYLSAYINFSSQSP